MQVEDDVLRGLSPAERRRMLALLRRAVDSSAAAIAVDR